MLVGSSELINDEILRHYVRRGAVTTVLAGNCAARVAVFQQQSLPLKQFWPGSLTGDRRRRVAAIFGDKSAGLSAQSFVLGFLGAGPLIFPKTGIAD